MKFIRGTIVLVLDVVCSPVIAQEAAPGTHEVSMSRTEIEKTLHEIEPHVREYPPRFESALQRRNLQDKLVRLLVFLDGAAKENADNPDVLIRDAVANGFGHNMGFPDCGEKAIAAFERLLKLQPDSAKANWRYGAFLAQTTKHELSIPYLQKAASFGVVNAHYTAAMVFLSLNDQTNAKTELKAYVQGNPKDNEAKGIALGYGAWKSAHSHPRRAAAGGCGGAAIRDREHGVAIA